MLVNHGPSQQRSKVRIQVLEMRCYRKLLRISYKNHVTNEEVRAKFQQDHTKTSPDHRKETQTAVVWSCPPFIRSGQNHLARHSEKRRKTRQTEEEVGRQHRGMDRPGVCQLPEGSGEQGKMEETGCKIICGVPTTFADKGLMMMMMMISIFCTQDYHMESSYSAANALTVPYTYKKISLFLKFQSFEWVPPA